MNVSRSGYYKWLKNKDLITNYETNRIHLKEFIIDIHNRKPSYGYRRINAIIRNSTGWIVSNNLVHKCCKQLDIKSKAKHYGGYKKPGAENKVYANVINNDWSTTRPFEKIVSDTTQLWFKNTKYDFNYYLDTFNNEIIGYDVRLSKNGCGNLNHRKSLEMMLEIKIKRGYKDLETISHSDQGNIYTSYAFDLAHFNYNIKRSMSRIGTPTDNPIIESINGWLKKEILVDYNIDTYKDIDDFISDVIYDYNNLRPAYALKYKTPIQYRTELGFK